MMDLSDPAKPVEIFSSGKLSHRGMTVGEVGGKNYLFLSDCPIFPQTSPTPICG